MIVVNINKFDATDPTCLLIEASTIQLKPGDWPAFIMVATHQNEKEAEGELFFRGEKITRGVEFGGYAYGNRRGHTLLIFND